MLDVLYTFLMIAAMFISFFAIFAGVNAILNKLLTPSRNVSRIAGILTFLVFAAVLILLIEVLHVW